MFQMELFKGKPLYTFHCGEQALMALKAVVFKDYVTLSKIINCNTAFQALQLGREVKPFNDEVWKAKRMLAAQHVIKARLDSDPTLDTLAKKMANRRFVEASPRNKVWGVGLSEDNPDIHFPEKYKGFNLHGVCWNAVLKERFNVPLKEQTSKGVIK